MLSAVNNFCIKATSLMFVRLFGSKYASAMKTQNSCLQFKSMAQDQSLEILIQMTKKKQYFQNCN